MKLICLGFLSVLVAFAQGPIMVDCETTKGILSIQLQPEWAPKGVERFLHLVDGGFYSNIPLFRCVKGFLCQFGYSSNPKQASFEETFEDDPPQKSTQRFQQGYVSFAGNGPNSRSCHVFVTLGRNIPSLGREPWETPIGQVTRQSWTKTVSKWNTEYDDMSAFNPHGVDVELMERDPSYLTKNFPRLDYIRSCQRRQRRNISSQNVVENEEV